MANVTGAMLYHFLVLGRELFAITIPIIIKTTAQTIAAMFSKVSQCIIISNHWSLPLRIWEHLLPTLRSRCQQDNISGIAFILLFTALALLTVICISSIISSHPRRQIHPDITRLHSLERAITRQIEINYHLSRPSQNRKLQNANCNTAELKQWALHWSDIKRFCEQAEADFKHGAPNWYYDDHPDCAQRYHELTNELSRLHDLGRNIVNAREDARKYTGNAVVGKKGAVVNDEGWMRRKAEALMVAQVDEMDTRRRSGYGKRKSSGAKAVFQQQIDTVGRLTPGGRLG